MAFVKTDKMKKEIKKFIKGYRLSMHLMDIYPFFKHIATKELKTAQKYFDELPAYEVKYTDKDFMEFLFLEAEKRVVYKEEKSDREFNYGYSTKEEFKLLMDSWYAMVKNVKGIDYIKNSNFLKLVKIPMKKYGGFNTKKIEMNDDTFFPTGNFVLTDDYLILPEFYRYSGMKCIYPAIRSSNEEGTYEFNTNMIENNRPIIDGARGKTLCFGTLFGYLPFEMAMKDNVSSVVAVEEDEDYFDFINARMMKALNKGLGINQKKITWIHEDSFDYLEKIVDENDGEFPFDTVVFANYKNIEDLKSIYADYLDFFKDYPNVNLVLMGEKKILYYIMSRELGSSMIEYFISKLSAKERDEAFIRDDAHEANEEALLMKADIEERNKSLDNFYSGLHDFIMNKIKKEYDFKSPDDIKNLYTFEKMKEIFDEYCIKELT